MATIFDVDITKLIEKLTEELKKIETIKPTDWSIFVKTGLSKQKTPVRDDWWYVRAASILITVYKKGPIGVSKLRVKYGSKKNRGNKPEKFYRGSGNIIRKILQQLEASELLSKEDKSIHKGRKISNKGKSFVDKIAAEVIPSVSK